MDGRRVVLLALVLLTCAVSLHALPRKPLNQYGHRIWTQAEGLPQDTVRAITQTTDGYLWVGTDEGLARFDGYGFVSFGKRPGELPDAAITALVPGPDGTLWIATAGALTRFRNGQFQTWAEESGLDRGSLISDLRVGPDGSVWIAAGLHLFRFRDGRFIRYSAAPDSGIQGIRVVLPEADGTVWVAAYGSLGQVSGSQVVRVLDAALLNGNIATGTARSERSGRLLLSGSEGLFEISGEGQVRRYTDEDGLPDKFVRCLREDREGNLWVGTNSGIARRERDRFHPFSTENLRAHEWVWAVSEDRDGSLWVGTNSGLHQLLNQPVAVLTQADGLPSDQPTAIHQDRRGRIWIGFHDRGAGYLDPMNRFVPVSGLPSQEVFSIRETRSGDLLIGTRGGLSRVRGQQVLTEFTPVDGLGRHNVFDAVEDSRGRLWVGSNQGLTLRSTPRSVPEVVVPGGVLLSDAAVSLLETRDGSVWTGIYGRGLWRVKPDGSRQRYGPEQGIPGDGIRAIAEDGDGSLWIGTFGGGVARLRPDGSVQRLDSGSGLPSDIVGGIIFSGDDVWFATARGLARVRRAALEQYWKAAAGQHAPVATYTVAQGLRSAQCVPGYPTGTGGAATADGRLWFPTGYGVAIFDPANAAPVRPPPVARVVELSVDGKPVALPAGAASAQIPADARRVEIRFTAVELTQPETLVYRYRLDGVDRDWVEAAGRRSTEYNNLAYGSYTFRVAASLGAGVPPGNPAVFALTRLPHWYELMGVRLAAAVAVAALVWLAWRMRLRQINQSFSLVLEERSRIAREIHDTLAQGFVGIGSQLDAVALTLRGQPDAAARHLELARRMSRHSLSEARRSIFDLREGNSGDLSSAIRAAVAFVTAGRKVATEFDIDAGSASVLPAEAAQQVVRIVQEAASNSVRHGAPTTIRIRVRRQAQMLEVSVSDDGSGFDASEALSASGGHFGLLGMQERAERIHATFHLQTAPGSGTTIVVTVPLQTNDGFSSKDSSSDR